MKRFSKMMFAGALVVSAGAAMAANGSLNEFRARVLPVLVHVDAKGGITDVSPSTELTPRMNRLLRQNLDEMIAKPATEHGRPISSQVIINLALETTPRSEGDYFARFTYVSSSPVPNGSWYWVHIDGHRLALANRNDFDRQPRLHFENRSGYQGERFNSYSREPPPPIQNTSRNAPSPAPKAGH
jgi:hypothetical protein